MNTTNALKHFLAHTYTLMIKTHSYHWNVVGPHFYQLHKMFEDQYTRLFSATDRIAERIRALGEYPPGGLAAYRAVTFIQDPKEGLSSELMMLDLIDDHRKMVIHAQECIAIANKYEDDATANMLTERIEEHEKMLWMMHSCLDKSPLTEQECVCCAA